MSFIITVRRSTPIIEYRRFELGPQGESKLPLSQFAINTSKPPAPVALQGRLCLSAEPHEYKRSLVWLNLPYLANLGIPRAGRPPLSISILQR